MGSLAMERKRRRMIGGLQFVDQTHIWVPTGEPVAPLVKKEGGRE